MRPSVVVAHHHPARIARQPLRRSRGNARPVLEDGLAGLIRVREHGGVYVDHDLIPLARRAGIELVAEGGLGEQCQRIRLLLGHRRALRGRVGEGRVRSRGPAARVERLAGRGERPD